MTPRIGYVLWAGALLAAAAGRADTLTLHPAAPGGAEYAVEGTIVDATGEAIVLERPGGSRKAYPRDRVARLQTDWPAAYDAARRSMRGRAWAAAAAELQQAGGEERRPWARRQVFADLMRVRVLLDQWEDAGELMIALDASDPTTRAWGDAPLPWHAAEGVRPATARRWLGDTERPAARLLGAAWLLASADRPPAETTLRRLATEGPPNVAPLAEAQLWRQEITLVNERQADAWRRRVERMPPHLRAGPAHVVAQAYYRLARYDDAALTALEGPLTGGAPRRLAARGLILAGRAAQKTGHADEARRLWTEARDDYADTPQRADARSLLDTL